jgi:CDP-4-dehydro-6-deoxyglucose reductase
MCPGDLLDVELPLGQFRFHEEDYRQLLMIATGTGIAPIKAILESLLDDPDCPPVALYWGVRDASWLYVDDDIRGWADRLYEFRYEPVLSRPGPGWEGRTGHVQDAVLDDIHDLSDHSIYLCGSPNMIRDAKRAFLARGASVEHLYADGFNFQAPAAVSVETT